MMMVVTNARLRILASYEAKIAKICNFWTFRPVILFFPKREKQDGHRHYEHQVSPALIMVVNARILV